MNVKSPFYLKVLSDELNVAANSEEALHDVKEVISFKGGFTAVNTDVYLRKLESSLDRCKYPRPLKKRVYSLAVEMIQNIVHHGLVGPDECEPNFSVIDYGGLLHAFSRNCVFVGDIQKISSAIDMLNGMNDAELRKYHVELLCDNEFSSKGGAGLGLVTLARKSDEKIAYTLVKVNDSMYALTLHIKISPLRKETL